MRRAIELAAVALLMAAGGAPVQAQFSSNIAGIPSGSIPFFGGSQGRFEFDLTGFKLPTEAAGDSVGGRIRLGFGHSWRIASQAEFGFDLTLAEADVFGTTKKPESVETKPVTAFGSFGYGLRVGLKVQPIAYLTPEGYGVSVAVGVAYQPSVQVAASFDKKSDSTNTNGLVAPGTDSVSSAAKIHSSVQALVAVSYNSPRLMADLALIEERASDDQTTPLTVYDGFSARLGGKVRLTPGFALGAVYWGGGAPPWRDRLARGSGTSRDQRFGVVLGFGSTPGKGTDLIISSPMGSFGRAVNLYWSVR